MSELEAANIRPFVFASTSEKSPTLPYAISTSPSKENDSMEASLLMSPDYIQPLVPSELNSFVAQMFESDSISWLRHSAAKKFIAWRASSTPIAKPQALYRPLISGPMCGFQSLTAPVGATTSYALARITDHTQREERIAQVRLANWAADLQRSLQNERARFDALARSERAVWLTERLGECVQDGTIIPISRARQNAYDSTSGALVNQGTYSRRRAKSQDSRGGIDRHDPLGLLMLNEELKRKSWVVLKVVSSFGLLGGLAFWVTRSLQGSETDAVMWGFGGLGIRDWVELGAVDWR